MITFLWPIWEMCLILTHMTGTTASYIPPMGVQVGSTNEPDWHGCLRLQHRQMFWQWWHNSYIHLQVLQHGDNTHWYNKHRNSQFTGNKIGTWQNVAPHIYKDSTPNTVSYCIIYSNYPAGGDQSILWTVLEDKFLQYLTSLNLKYFTGNYYSNGTLHMRQPERLLVVIELPYTIWQQNNDMLQVPTHSLIAPVSITMLLIIMTQNITDYGNYDTYVTRSKYYAPSKHLTVDSGSISNSTYPNSVYILV